MLIACGGNSSPQVQPPPAPPPVQLSIKTSTLPSGTVGVGYNAPLAATGGTPPYSWSLTSGSLPGLLNLIPGNIAGVPNAAGTTNLTLKVSDAASSAATVSLSLTIAPSSVLVARFQEAYSYNLTASFGTGPYNYALASGALPPGLSLASNGAINGNPTDTGAFNFSVLITDSLGAHQTVPYAMNVIIGTDPYGGFTAAPLPGCASSGYFQLKQVGNRWMFADPQCNAFYLLGAQDLTYGNLESSVLTNRYGGSSDVWITHSLQRIQSYGFNTVAEYGHTDSWPGGTWSSLPIQMPFVLMMNATKDAELHYASCGSYTQPIKDILQGLTSTIQSQIYYGTPMIDLFDPMFQACVTYEVGNLKTIFQGSNFNNNKYLLGITTEDADYIWALKGTGTQHLGTAYPHMGYLIAVANFAYNGGSGSSLFSKQHWIAYLQNKYGSIAALNAAWGSTYTSFGDAGGWGSGTGVLDEDGRHTTWMGGDPYLIDGSANANVVTDLNQLLYDYAFQFESVEVNSIRAYDTNHLIFGPVALGGVGAFGIRPQVIQAFSDAGVDVISTNYDPAQPQTISTSLLPYSQAGKPAYIWYGSSANADSYWHTCHTTNDADFPTQAVRGQHYTSDQSAILNAQTSSGTYPVLGVSMWALTDSGSSLSGCTGETTNWGVISNLDNAYDGKCVVAGATVDPFGFPCGGEAANYGNFTDAVSAANLNVVKSLIVQQLP